MTPIVLRADDGRPLPFDPARWHGEPTALEDCLLDDMTGPVLDVGCGPGRLVVGLGRRGIPALGVDPAPGAIALARQRGASVLQRSVFDPLPGEGRWRTVLLLDGNVGIGGDAVRLLRRCRSLMAPDATLVAEVDAPGVGWRTCRARLERDEQRGPWFAWTVVGADAIASVAEDAGLSVTAMMRGAERRWFAYLSTPSRAAGVDAGSAGVGRVSA